MKTLYLVRHAKSDWSDESLDDFDRPLNKRGKRNAPVMGKLLKTKGIRPDLILSSPANRAITTARIIASEIDYALERIQAEKQVYEASPKTLTKIISRQSSTCHSLMLVGHNPGLTEFANYVSDFDADNIPTTGIVCIQFAIDKWQDLERTAGKLAFFHYPKEFK